MKKNIFVMFLDFLDVKYSNFYSDLYYNEHPYKTTLYGLSQMCFHYGIENAVLEVDKSELIKVDVPFITSLNNEFALIFYISNYVDYYSAGKIMHIPVEDFLEQNTGIVLVAEKTEASKEPDYRKHKIIDIFRYLRYYLLFISVLLYIYISIQDDLFLSKTIVVSLFLNLIAVFVSLLLLRKQMNMNDRISTQICSAIRNGSCNAVLNTKGSKLFDVISWSEIGFSFFLSNLVMLFFYNELLEYYILFTLLAFPYTLWSVWYQKIRIKQWCPLCLIVQFVLCIIVFVNVNYILDKSPYFNVLLFAKSLSIYMIILFSTSYIYDAVLKNTNVSGLIYKMNRFKYNADVFMYVIKKQKFYYIDDFISNISIGDLNSLNMITLVINPFCLPCYLMHNQITDIIVKKNVHIKYVFTTFGLENDDICKILIYSYEKSPEFFTNTLSEWYNEGRLNPDCFIRKYQFCVKNSNLSILYDKHKKFVTDNNILKTPTVLYNGFELPEEYSVGDLLYIL